ncbi:MAG: peptidoglycan recognition protein family protein, partial [Nocardioidaceae bacterium]
FGDLRRNVIGAHTLGYNHVSFAMSAIGNFETARPSAPMLRAYVRLMGWRLGKYGINAGAMRRRLEGHTFRAISGHRDAGQTLCPGIHLYRRIRTIRRLAVNWQQNGTTTAPTPTETPPPTEPPTTEPPPSEPPPEPPAPA